MLSIFADMVEDSMEVFIDEFLVVGDTFKACLEHLGREGIVWEHKILGEGIQVDQAKVKVVTKLPPPISVKGVRNFLVHAGFYQSFIKRFSKVDHPLCKILEKESAFEFNKDCVKAFLSLIEKLILAPIIVSPELDFEVKYQKGCENEVANLMSRLEMNGVVSNEKDTKEAFSNASVIVVLNDHTIKLCIPEVKVDAILEGCHASLTSGHHSGVCTAAKVLQICYYWTTLYQDANSFVKRCVQCQKKGGVSWRHELPLPPILEVELYEVWGINFMRPFVSSYGNNYILVAIDYVSKWVEVVDLPNNEGRSVVKLLKRYIFMTFGTPRVIISDGGSHFCNRIFASLLRKYGVKNKVATPYHPKTSGQVKLLVLNQEKDWGGDALGHFGELRLARRVYSVCWQLSSPSSNFQADEELMLLSVMTLQLAEVNSASR
ncbi:hypothetical protein MTR67_007377 [Solanum verrucosum]|uniref:Integrase catalytic domain-containing protein n=1 Tax=Solanum verrucosum TaxID=315347 RepID=A0AAF0PZR2_SOLVR|nr:hypothetical protein MTR67_007377 [Solanum verrucosum]